MLALARRHDWILGGVGNPWVVVIALGVHWTACARLSGVVGKRAHWLRLRLAIARLPPMETGGNWAAMMVALLRCSMTLQECQWV